MENYLSEMLRIALNGLVIMTALMFIIWLLHIPIKNAGIVDIGWGTGLLILAVLYYFLGQGYEPIKLLITLMVFIWGSRLAFYLFLRAINGRNEDGRYIQIRIDRGNNILIKFFFFFEFQGVLNKDKTNKGNVCNTGLWKYSRHPNYFFEFLVWFGYGVTALSSPNGYFALIAPAIILYLLSNVTGIPAAVAQSIRSKCEAYRQYQKVTSKIISWKPGEN